MALKNIKFNLKIFKIDELHYELNPTKKLKENDLFDKIISGDLKVHFVMAYRNFSYKNKTAIEKIEWSESNIAKFSLVQTIREIRSYKNFEIHVIDISQLNNLSNIKNLLLLVCLILFLPQIN